MPVLCLCLYSATAAGLQEERKTWSIATAPTIIIPIIYPTLKNDAQIGQLGDDELYALMQSIGRVGVHGAGLGSMARGGASMGDWHLA